MRVMVFVKATEDSEKGNFPEPETSEIDESLLSRVHNLLTNCDI